MSEPQEPLPGTEPDPDKDWALWRSFTIRAHCALEEPKFPRQWLSVEKSRSRVKAVLDAHTIQLFIVARCPLGVASKRSIRPANSFLNLPADEQERIALQRTLQYFFPILVK